MPATASLHAAPPNALLIWHGPDGIYIELPGPDNRPVVLRYPSTTAGLQSALGIIRTKAARLDRAYGPPEPTNAPGTPAQREVARFVLRKMGLMG